MKNLHRLSLLFLCYLCACDHTDATNITDTADTSHITDTADTADITNATDSTDTTPPLSVPAVPQIDWQTLGEIDIDFEGQSDVFEAPIPANTRYVALRVIPLGNEMGDEIGGVCSRLEDVSLASGEVLVGPTDVQAPEAVCTECSAPVSWANGASVFVLGQGATAAPIDADALSFKLQLRDCSLGVRATRNRFPELPTRARVTFASAPRTDFTESRTLSVRMAYGAASGAHPTTNDPHMAEVWRVASERFAAAGITLQLEAEAHLTADDTRVVYGPSAPEPLHALQAEVLARLSLGAGDVRFVPVLWVGCLLQDDPLTGARHYPVAQTTRIPGSLGDDIAPSLVLIATGTCDPTVTPARDAEFEGLVLAHELGHYLGLYHTDTAAGALLPAGDDEQLMRSGFAQTITPAQAWFSPAQMAAMHRHPDLH